ncbi:hypothetical protein C0Q70_06236 [Pomacea canaliculata]|uniref:Uncharacterized protein n=1 Tax=Pomacea canaliculata TaxID=400727 RepID=A0A2T7PNF4_POMCA|nr:hypothetical protein C0Q70_06236 [Pomacea canaliculata]
MRVSHGNAQAGPCGALRRHEADVARRPPAETLLQPTGTGHGRLPGDQRHTGPPRPPSVIGGFEMNGRQAIGDHSDGCLPIILSETDPSAHGRPSTSDGYSTLKAKTTNLSDSLDSVFLEAGREAEDLEMTELLRNPIVSDHPDNGACYFWSDTSKVKNLACREEKMVSKMVDSETGKMSDFSSPVIWCGLLNRQ